MGSQHVDVILKKGRVIKDVVIFNAEEGHSPEAFAHADIGDQVVDALAPRQPFIIPRSSILASRSISRRSSGVPSLAQRLERRAQLANQ